MTRRADRRRAGRSLLALLLSGGAGTAAVAQAPGGPAPGPLEEIIVFGRATELLGAASAASEGSVGGADLLVRPMLRVAELLEAVPGLVAAQHSGSGKANQYFLRGFNLDHGTDFTTLVDGVPWNLRSHGHGQGYLDVNGLLPEIVDRIDYRKGTYRADIGDFAMVASSFIGTIDRLERPFAALESGEYGWSRLAGGSTLELSGAELTLIGEHKRYDGPWQRHEEMAQSIVWGKYVRPTDFGTMRLSLTAYDGNWHPTEQIPERAIGTSVCADAFCALDPTADGDTQRLIVTAQVEGDAWRATGYVQSYDWFMQSNPTYDFQINQFDKRTTIGGRYDHLVVETDRIALDVGADFRHDDIGPVGLDEFEAGSFVANISNNDIDETSLGAYAEVTWFPTAGLRLLGGARVDHFDFDVTAASAGSFAGSASDSRVSPKLGVAYAATDSIELYGNWGKGFHSNDARGVVNAAVPVPGLSPGTGYETGTRFEIGDLRLTAAYWWLNQDSELIFVGDSNSVEPKGGSRREGYELVFFWRPLEWLGIDAVYTGSRARYIDNPEGRHIEGAVEHAGQIGLAAVKDRWEASARLRYLGPYALVPDNSLRAGGTTSFNLRGAYTLGRFTLYADLLNVFDADGKDIVYYYPAYVAGLDPPGLTSDDIDCAAVNCRMSRAEEPRTLRLGVKLAF